MAFHSLKDVFKSKTMTRPELRKLASGLNSTLDCVDGFEALQEKGGYDTGRQFPQVLDKRGLQQRLLNRWLLNKPDVNALQGLYYDYPASYIGREFARYIRVRAPGSVVLRVYVKQQNTGPERCLLQLLASLIWNIISLLPPEFPRVEQLSRKNFDCLQAAGEGSLEAGLAILKSLTLLDLRNEKMLCVVDGLDLAESEDTLSMIHGFDAALRTMLASNGAHLLYTFTKTSKAVKIPGVNCEKKAESSQLSRSLKSDQAA
ncbi:hypothetical protein F4780DRAFT_16787 [Xylariomycetidae sp. FL0641]|nr:hypothetical protein F4780DRAFT_16787 [Xylariomycetidae sp. FL0641]